jgi:hypothetical protein
MRGSWANISKNRLIFVAIAVLTFCVVCIGFGYGLLESAKYERQANDKIGEYAEHTRDKVAQVCVGSAKIENIKCVTEAFEAKREYEYNQSDLVAQRQSALWAYIMAGAAVIGLALSAGGVWLVKTTFDETRTSNLIAEKFQRARIEPVAKIIDSDHGTRVISINAKNIGGSVAINLTGKMDVSNKNPDDMSNFDGKTDSVRFTILAGSEEMIFGADGISDDDYIFGKFTYQCIFGKIHNTLFSFKIEKWPTSYFIKGRASRVAVPSLRADWPKDT